MSGYLALLLGIACAAIGGDLFVRGLVGLSRWVRVAPAVMGASVAAFATSSPEFSVAVMAAASGRPEIALGDALGSNVVNVALVLAITVVLSGLRVPAGSATRDFPVALAAPPLTALLLLDGTLSRGEGLVLLAAFVAWLAAAAAAGRRAVEEAHLTLSLRERQRAVGAGAAGLAILLVAGQLIMTGATDIATALGMDTFVIGATVVALGTSTPELATALVARFRGHDDVGLGTLLGSNIFNGLCIVAVAALIHPIAVPVRQVGLTLGFGLVAVLVAFPSRARHIGRGRALALLVLYGAYLVATLR